MFRIFALCIILLTGCTLSTTNEEPTPIEATLSIPTTTPTTEATSTLRPTSTDSPTIQPAPTSCVPVSGWMTYVVQSGDTLFSIAERSGTTVAQLTTGNCLADPNQLRVGQALLVPRAVATEVVGCERDYFFNPNSDLTACPADRAQQTNMLIQSFERGYMLWRSDAQTVYVMFGRQQDGGAVETYSFNLQEQRPAITPETPPQGFYAPQGVFAFVYHDNRDRYLNALGWGTNEVLSYGGMYQPANNGQFFADWPLDSRILAIGNNIWSFVGAANRVPEGTPTGPLTPGLVIGTTIVDPFISSNRGVYELQPGTTVTLVWEDAPSSQIIRGEFAYFPAGGGRQSIGFDGDMSNGVSLSWVVPNGLNGTVSAFGYTANTEGGSVFSTPIQVVSAGNPPPTVVSEVGTVQVTPVLRVDGDVTVLLAELTVTLLWSQAPTNELTQVDFVYYPSGGGSGVLLGIDADLSDGALIEWRVPNGLDGRIVASGRIPGQNHDFRISEALQIRSQIR